MEKELFFDAGPIISLVMSRLGWILPELKRRFKGSFYITPAVKRELVERPLQIKRFEFEAMEVLKLIREGVLEVYEEVPQQKVEELKSLANSSFRIKNKTMDVVQSGELESVAVVKEKGGAVVMDERTLRLFIENSGEMERLLERRFMKDVTADGGKIRQFSHQLQGIKIIRSVELVGVAYRLGLLDNYIPTGKELREGRRIMLDAVLWGTKINGCAVTKEEIEEMERFLLK